MKKPWSIRAYLLSLILALALPIFGLLIHALRQDYNQALAAAGQDTLRIAEIAAADLARFTGDTRHFLRGLARRVAREPAPAPSCDPLLGALRELYPQFANIALTDRHGQILCSALQPEARTLPHVGAMPWFKDAATHNGFHIGDAHLGPVSQKWVAVLSEALRDSAGRFDGLIGYSLDLAAFPLLVSEAGALGDDLELYVMENDGKVILRSPKAPVALGQTLSLPALALRHDAGNAYHLDEHQRHGRIVAHANVIGTHWRVVVTRPTAPIVAPHWVAANQRFLGALLLLGLAVGLALAVGRRIAEPARRIAQTARQVAEGDTTRRTEPAGPGELASVARDFNTMLDIRLRAEERYRNLLETASDGILVINAEALIELANPQAELTFGYPPGGLLGQPLAILLPEDQRLAHARAVSDFFAAPSARRMGRVVRGLRRDGSVFPCDIALSPSRGEQGTAVCAVVRDLSERVEFEARLTELAQRDPLTGLPNRTLLLDRLEQALARSQRSGERVALARFDLDRFREINDFHGAAFADRLLVGFAAALRESLREADSVIRVGSDEFIAIIEDPAAEVVAQSLHRRLSDDLARHFAASAGRPVSVSAGVALHPCPGGAHELLKHADLALDHARAGGGGRLCFFELEMDQRASARRQMLESLHGALARGELRVCYQPQVATAGGRVLGVEALLRWDSPTLGAISPAQFIPLAEESGLIEEIGAWVLRQACAQAMAWEHAGLPPLRMAVNLSPRQFHGDALLPTVHKALSESGLPADRLELEITEGMLMKEPEQAARLLSRLAQQGVRIAIDDFGTGYSSLAYLRRFSVDVLKVDQSFVRDLGGGGDAAAIVEAVVSLAASLRLDVVAEGVETAEQHNLLRRLGCAMCQGYLFGKPVPAEGIAAMLRQATTV